MQLPIDERILEILSSSNLVLSPAIISENIEKSRSEVNRRLSELVDKGFIERPRRGRYRIAADGRAYLSGDLDASELESNDTDQ
jgi:DNA-binding IclR family transcriptional regulator